MLFLLLYVGSTCFHGQVNFYGSPSDSLPFGSKNKPSLGGILPRTLHRPLMTIVRSTAAAVTSIENGAYPPAHNINIKVQIKVQEVFSTTGDYNKSDRLNIRRCNSM